MVCAGECMLELRPAGAGTFALGFAGDTYNTAVYLKRVATELGLDLDVAYLTGVGDDRYSELMRAAWADEDVRDLAVVVPGGRPGLYAIENGPDGERRFTYWRHDSAARTVLRRRGWLRRLDGDVVYLSGITVQLMSAAGRARVLDHLQRLRRARGCRVAFDTNYRAAGWTSRAEAATAIDQFAAAADIVLATLEDEIALHGALRPGQAAGRLSALGPGEVVVKHGADGVWLATDGRVRHLPAVPPERVVDTTAAGDAFAGAYLAARLTGAACASAAASAAAVASVVIAHPGAITPRTVRLTQSG